MAPEEILECDHLLWQSMLCLKILVIYGQGIVAKVDDGDFGTCLSGGICGNFYEFLIPRISAEAAAEGKDFGGHLVAPSGLWGWRVYS